MLDPILKTLPRYHRDLQEMRDFLLANTLMFGEIAAPTFREEERIQFLKDRFNEGGLTNISIDELGNGMATLPGQSGKSNILVVSRADTPFSLETNPVVTVHKDYFEGPGVGNSALGLAVIATLPQALDALDIVLESNLILMGATQSQGAGNLAGIRFFLDNNTHPISSAICLKGLTLGRLSYSSLGIAKGEITCSVAEKGRKNAISSLMAVINGMEKIHLPEDSCSEVILGSLSGGTSYNVAPSTVLLRFEIRSKDEAVIYKALEQLREITDGVSRQTGSQIMLNIIARVHRGSLDERHPLIGTTRQILDALELEPREVPSSDELSALISKGIPSITLGLTTGKNAYALNEIVFIDPIFTGLAQLIGLLEAIDKGCCRGDN